MQEEANNHRQKLIRGLAGRNMFVLVSHMKVLKLSNNVCLCCCNYSSDDRLGLCTEHENVDGKP